MQAKDIYLNSFLQKMREGQIVSSMTVKLVKGIEVAQIAKTAGFDAIYIDLEHSALSLESTGQICMAAANIGLSPFVRVPANTPEWISRVLDNGAMGVIAPHISTQQEALAVVACAKFPPTGERSAAGALPHLQYRSFPASEAYPVLNSQTTVIVQFESEKAIENAESIMSTDGVDVVLIGSNDLTADMGIAGQYDHPKLKAAFEHTIQVCKAHGKFCGVGGLSSRPDLVAQFTQMGAQYVSSGTDLSFLISAATEKAKQVQMLNT
jgi:2-keto-3-deoxy-L-rhamnonate aldolase RhmA